MTGLTEATEISCQALLSSPSAEANFLLKLRRSDVGMFTEETILQVGSPFFDSLDVLRRGLLQAALRDVLQPYFKTGIMVVAHGNVIVSSIPSLRNISSSMSRIRARRSLSTTPPGLKTCFSQGISTSMGANCHGRPVPFCQEAGG